MSADGAMPGLMPGAATGAGPGRAGVIHDLGYRRYAGARLGRAAIVRALAWHSLRSAFGIGCGAKAKVVPVLTFVVMCLPAVANAVAVANGGSRIVPYDTYVFRLRALVMIIFIAAQAPELVSRDLRSHVLPLYFSRPLRRTDYPLAKYAAFTLACLAMIELPLLFLYLGTIAQAKSGGAVWQETRALTAGLAVGVLWAALPAAIGLVLASFSGRRAYATGIVAIYFVITWVLASILEGVSSGRGPITGGLGPPSTGAELSGLVSPFTVLDGVRQWLGGTSPGPIPGAGHQGAPYMAMLVLLFALALGGLAARYRKAGVA